ncbi:MAG: proton-conducting transporter membrane subunit [Acetobacteraceae bacterium]|nr:proton-conducting transporter membrane subunit [Acetobacteraceae bacterium]
MLITLALALVVLAMLSLAAPLLARGALGVRVVYAGAGLACLVFALGGMAGLVAAPAALASPFGPPWGAMRLALDPLSAWFLLILGLCGVAASAFAFGHVKEAEAPRRLVPYPLFVAGMALTLLAADGFTLVLGFELMSFASWVLVAHEHENAENRRAARLYLGFAALGGAALILCFGLLAAGASAGAGFAALRAAPPDGLRALAILLLVVIGAGSKAGLVPLHVWLPLAHPAAPSHVSALMSAAMTKVALYVLARVVFDLAGPAQPLFWGAVLMALGIASAIMGALRAAMEEDTKTLLACSTIENIGLITLGLGLALAFRAADLGALAAVAAGAALLHALNHAMFKTLLFLGAGEVLYGAASRRMDRLGGLIHAMPWTAGLVLLGAAAAAALPPLSGFASEWLLLQALMAAWRVGDLAFQIGAAAATALAALAVALSAAAMLRFYGMVFLGRPRSPRAAGATELSGVARAALILPAALTVIFGLTPGFMLELAAPALRLLTGAGAGLSALGGVTVTVSEGGAGYAPLIVFVLLLLLGGGVVWFARRQAPGIARGPAWDCGFIAPPHHLPFGDPATQVSAAGMAQPLRRMLGKTLLAAREAVEMPPPGNTAPARLQAGFHDPVLALISGPLPRARNRLAALAERLRDFSLRQCLGLGFAVLLALMALLIWLERT